MDLPKFTSYMIQHQPDQTAFLLNKLSAGSGGGGGKLYNTTGTHTDGAMTQKATTEALGTKADAITVGQQLATKVDKVPGKELSSNDFTDTDVTKLNGIEAGAEVNVQSDWDEADNTADDYIKNKPTIPTNTSQLNNDSGFLVSGDNVSELANDANYVIAETPGTPILNTPYVGTTDIINSAVTTSKLDSGAVTTGKIDAEAVTTAKIADGAVTTDKIADGVVTESKIDWTQSPCVSRFVFSGNSMTTETVTKTTKRGTELEFTFGPNSFYISGGADNIKRARMFITYDHSSSTSPYGCIGAYIGSNLWTYYTGENNGTAVNTHAGNTTDAGVNYGTIFNAPGTKTRFTAEFDALRPPGSLAWSMFGYIMSVGSGTSFTVRTEITAETIGILPGWYQRSVTPTKYYIEVEVCEE